MCVHIRKEEISVFIIYKYICMKWRKLKKVQTDETGYVRYGNELGSGEEAANVGRGGLAEDSRLRRTL